MTNERLRQSIKQLTKDTAAEWQAGYEAGVRASAYALEALERIAGIKADDGEDFSEWHDDVIIRCEITVADLKAVRAALEARGLEIREKSNG